MGMFSNSYLVYPPDIQEETPYIRFEIDNKNKDYIILPQPPGLTVQDGAAYGTLDLTTVIGGNDIIKRLVGGKPGKNDLTAGYLFGKEKYSDIFGIDASEVGALSALKNRIAVNKYQRTTYETQNIRAFSFAFKFVAQSKSESDTILKIEEIFRRATYPRKVGGIALEYPPAIDIKFMIGEEDNPYFPQIFRTQITGFSTVYNSSTNAFHKDGQPVEVDMTIELQEDSQLFRDEDTDELRSHDSSVYSPGKKKILSP